MIIFSAGPEANVRRVIVKVRPGRPDQAQKITYHRQRYQKQVPAHFLETILYRIHRSTQNYYLPNYFQNNPLQF